MSRCGPATGFVEALERGWSPDNVRGKAAADEQPARIAVAPAEFIAALENLGWIELTTDPDNVPSQKVIVNAGEGVALAHRPPGRMG